MKTKKKTNISGVSPELSQSITKSIKDQDDRINLPLENIRIGLSLSESDEYQELGFSKMHQKDITIELTRYLLVNGAKLIYGGDLRKEGYTYLFSELAFQYRKKDKQEEKYFINYFAWPIYNSLNNADLAIFKKNRVEVVKVQCSIKLSADAQKKKKLSKNADDLVLEAECISLMRERMIDDSSGRIFLGGRMKKYKGFIPGLIEEASLTLKAKQPFYLLGAFGGATGLIIRAITGENKKTLAKEVIDSFPEMKKLNSVAGRSKYDEDLQRIFSEFAKFGIKGLSRLNRLTEEENEILFETVHFHEMIYYILEGFKRKIKS